MKRMIMAAAITVFCLAAFMTSSLTGDTNTRIITGEDSIAAEEKEQTSVEESIVTEEKEPTPVEESIVTEEKEPTSREIMQSILSTYALTDGSRSDKVEELLDKLTQKDSAKGEAWRELMTCWVKVNTDTEINPGVCPDGLRNDSGLCIVVLGYALNNDGTMTEELQGRLETALVCAEKYPDAVIAVTGGGTAAGNPDATEADEMAKWLMENGVDSSRILIENESLTTSENALFTTEKLNTLAPQVTQLVIVTSDYHIKRGIMVFNTRMILGGGDIEVVSNAAYMTGRDYSNTVMAQASEVRGVARYYMD